MHSLLILTLTLFDECVGMEQHCCVQDPTSRLTAVEAFDVMQTLLLNLPPPPPALAEAATGPADQGEMHQKMQHLIAMVTDLHTYNSPT